MSFGRRATVWFLSVLLAVALWATAADLGLVHIFGGPKPVEATLAGSNIYKSIVPGLLDNAKSINSPVGNVPLSDPLVRSAAISTLTPQFLKTNVNQALDSIYSWLDGSVSQPKFTIKLTDVKNQFINKVVAGAQQKATSLPVCTTPPSSESIDIFGATCLPEGVTATEVADQVRSSMNSGQGFLDNTTISASDIKTSSNCPQGSSGNLDCTSQSQNPSFFTTNKHLPAQFRKFKDSRFLLAVVVILLSGLLILAYQPTLLGVRHVGVLFASAGVFMVIFGLAINEAVSNKVLSRITLSNSVFQTDLRNLVRDLVHILDSTYMLIGVAYLVIGGALIGLYFYLSRRQAARSPETAKSD